MYGLCKSLGLQKSFRSYASQLPGASILHFLYPWFLEVSGGSMISVGSQVFFSFMVALEDWNHWWLWHSCLLIWQDILHFLLSIPFFLLFWFFLYRGKTTGNYKLALAMGTCCLPLQWLNHVLLQLLVFNSSWKKFRVESKNEALLCSGKNWQDRSSNS